MLRPKVVAFIRRHSLLTPGQVVVVGVSGGPDSVCLLTLLVEAQAELGIELHVAHLNHMLRGAEAEADADYVASLASRLGLAATIARHDVASEASQRRASLEEAAREARYRFLADVVGAVGAEGAAVGHTADDQAETVLMHLVRGTGLDGLRGMRPLAWLRLPDGRRLRLLRPLLEVSRAEVEACCSQRGLIPRVDETNVSLHFLRNRIRHQLLPMLQGYNPAIRGALLRLASTVSDELDWSEEQVGLSWEAVARVEAGEVVLQSEPLRALPLALQTRLLRRAVQEVAGDLTDLTALHVEQMREALSGPAGVRLDLPRGLVFSVEYGTGRMSAGEPVVPLPELPGRYRLQVPGETVLPGWRVRAEARERREVDLLSPGRWRACLDRDRAGSDLVVRTRRPGDRFQPLGMRGSKRLQDFMVDARIPRAWRDRIPIVASPDHIVWVAGWRIDERVRVGPQTETVLCLEFTPDEEQSKYGYRR